MIEIDQETKQIYIYHAPEQVTADPDMHKFKLLSGYVCPSCGLILEAQYVGTLGYYDSEGVLNCYNTEGDAECHPYIPKKFNYDNNSEPKYKFRHKYGGGYLILDNHRSTSCKNEIANVEGVMEGIKYFLNWIVPTPVIVPTEYMLRNFAGYILEKKIPGFDLIEDVCKLRGPRLTVDARKFAENVKWEGHNDFDKEYRWKTILHKLIVGDTIVKLNTQLPEPEPVPAPKQEPVRKFDNKEAAYLSYIDNPTVPAELKAKLEAELGPEMVQLLKEQNEVGKVFMKKRQEAQLNELHTKKPAIAVRTGKRNVYEMIYDRLQVMGIIDENGKMQTDYMKFVSGGLMPLSVDNLGSVAKANDGGVIQEIALAHNGKQNGDIMADPDMQVRIYPEMKMAEAMTFQNDYTGTFHRVYTGDGKFYPKLKTELNAFLNSWLKRMIDEQKYVLESAEAV